MGQKVLVPVGVLLFHASTQKSLPRLSNDALEENNLKRWRSILGIEALLVKSSGTTETVMGIKCMGD